MWEAGEPRTIAGIREVRSWRETCPRFAHLPGGRIWRKHHMILMNEFFVKRRPRVRISGQFRVGGTEKNVMENGAWGR